MIRGGDGERFSLRPTRRRLLAVLGAVLAAIIAGLGLLIDDPIVFPVRSAIVVSLMAAAALASATALATRRRRVAALLMAAAGFVVWHGVQPWRDTASV